MLKETETVKTMSFVVIIFIIGGISIGARWQRLCLHAIDLAYKNDFRSQPGSTTFFSQRFVCCYAFNAFVYSELLFLFHFDFFYVKVCYFYFVTFIINFHKCRNPSHYLIF